MPTPISRGEAEALGLKRYFTGIACSKGHTAERTVLRNDCLECLRARQLKWAQSNSDAVNKRSQAWYASNKEKAAQTRAAWRARNQEKDRADVAAYQAANADRLRVAAKAWRQANPGKCSAKALRRSTATQQATPAWANKFFIGEAYHLAKVRSRVSGFKWHVDHIVPLLSPLVCGLHCEANLRVVPGSMNQSKGNRYWPDMPG